MTNALGIISFTSPAIFVKGISNYRPVAAFSYVGRYRLVDIPISNMTNSGIQNIQVYTNGNPKVLFDHIGSARHYNINNKHGHIGIIPVMADGFSSEFISDMEAYWTNIDEIEDNVHDYVVIAPVNWIYKANFTDLIQAHIDSKADVSMLYSHYDETNKPANLLNATLIVSGEKGEFKGVKRYIGGPATLDVSLDTYIMSKDKFVELVKAAHDYSPMFWMTDMLNTLAAENKIKVNKILYSHPVFPILDLKSYYNSNMEMLKERNMTFFNDPNWPIYTRTNDSSPTIYLGNGTAECALISNGCEIAVQLRNRSLAVALKSAMAQSFRTA
ncbi:sugar phosphate nucleotidyltransferase [Allobaculum sp. JKK-2023]|uniref:sugar phosphate nucleotidyltransferase n=1 Tax=Allobaculum sp. JKK-2023 TaxID=3108943 RepID=UPI002B05BF2A|nr:sugar phosphate nucleotidyltransferase [Allobaculum sp. JKK-2023]